MRHITGFKNYVKDEVIQAPAIISLSAVIGYKICGAPCAGIAMGTSALDLGLKYMGLTDSYMVTYGTLGAILGHKTLKPFTMQYKEVVGAGTMAHLIKDGAEGIGSAAASAAAPHAEGIAHAVANLTPDFLNYFMSAGSGALGILFSVGLSKAEHLVMNMGSNSTDMHPELVTEAHDSPCAA